MAARFRSMAAPGEALTRQPCAPAPPRRSRNPITEISKLLATKDDWQARQEGLRNLRELAAGGSTEWLAAHVDPLVPQLLLMLKELRSALFSDVCATIADLISNLVHEHDFSRAIPRLAEGLFNTPTREKMMFVAGNRCLATVMSVSHHSQLMGLIEEVAKDPHNFRMRSRGYDATLQMLLQWPVKCLQRHKLQLSRVLVAGCTDVNAYVRACARRGAMAMTKRLPTEGKRVRKELDLATQGLVDAEDEWVEAQLRNGCTFCVGDGSAPESEEVISAPGLGPAPRTDFRVGHGPGEAPRALSPKTGYSHRRVRVHLIGHL